jgi:hypothetical protein
MKPKPNASDVARLLLDMPVLQLPKALDLIRENPSLRDVAVLSLEKMLAGLLSSLSERELPQTSPLLTRPDKFAEEVLAELLRQTTH